MPMIKQRRPLAHTPTPIQEIKGLSLPKGQQLYIKRDDFTGLECSGNKIRKLEYCLAEAERQGCDTLLTVGAFQSNHCRATAQVAARLGLACELFLKGDPPSKAEGNFFYAQAFGATIHPLAADADHEAAMANRAKELLALGQRPYLIPLGASNARGSFGYARCFQEIVAQEATLGFRFDQIAVAVGSGGTYAGLLYENSKRSPAEQKQILGYAVAANAEHFQAIVWELMQGMQALEKASFSLDPQQIQILDHGVGKGYAQSSQEELAFYMRTAEKTGLLFDPCYTGKAFRSFVGDLQAARLQGPRSLFIHTGGLFGWTAEQREMALSLR